MSHSPFQQGKLDGLCGPYAIVNALGHMGSRKKPDEIFQNACAAVSRNRWPALLWEGTTFGDLKKMIAACVSDIDGVSVNYPFWRSAPTSNSAYWQEFDEIFEDEDALCGIIGLTRPSDHWLVVCRGGARLTFLDSDPTKSVKRVERSSLYAGERGPREKDWVIDRRELVVFRRTG